MIPYGNSPPKSGPNDGGAIDALQLIGFGDTAGIVMLSLSSAADIEDAIFGPASARLARPGQRGQVNAGHQDVKRSRISPHKDRFYRTRTF